MDIRKVAKKVVELCNAGKNFDVMETLYAEDIASVEPTGKATTGKRAVIEKSKNWAEGVEIHSEKVIGPYFHAEDTFATQTTWEITRKSSGNRETLEEVSVYTVKDGLITREVFFFGGDQW